MIRLVQELSRIRDHVTFSLLKPSSARIDALCGSSNRDLKETYSTTVDNPVTK